MIAVMFECLGDRFPNASSVAVSPGETLFRSGDPVRAMFLVKSGEVQLQRHSLHGTLLILQRCRAGEILAEASAYSTRYHCDAIAAVHCELLRIQRADFLETCRSNPEFSEAWARSLARGVQSARFRAEIRTLSRVADRLDAWLAEHGPLPGKGQWQDVAAELGVSREALYRELARRRRRRD